MERAGIAAYEKDQRAIAMSKHARGSHDRTMAYATIKAEVKKMRAQLRAVGKTRWQETRRAILADQPKAMPYAAWLRSLPPSPERDAEIEMVASKRHVPQPKQPQIVVPKTVVSQESTPEVSIAPSPEPRKKSPLMDPVKVMAALKGRPDHEVEAAGKIYARIYGEETVRGIWVLVGMDHPATIEVRTTIAHDLVQKRIDVDEASKRLKAANAEATRPKPKPKPKPPEPEPKKWKSWQKDEDKGRG